ncbi:MAG TPA: M48 family metalloprotease [Fimbriimonadaceae bacterium]|nr:M48 family metalloprotease [Fimbriimonadaceae bacterium]
MERAEFEQIVREMELLNKRDPDAYRKKVQRFVSLGYAAYFVAFVAVLGLSGLVVWLMISGRLSSGGIRLAIIAGVLLISFVRALWVKLDPPKGRLVRPEEAPVLIRELERIRGSIGAPPIHQVLVDPGFNAYATSSSRIGIFGERCYVVLGIPLLLTQTADEVIATLGHELAHHSRRHVKSGTRAYRMEQMWRRVLERLSAAGSFMVYPMYGFAKWYVPRFSAMSLVARRQAEFEADATGAEASSRQAMATGLIRMCVDEATKLVAFWDLVHQIMRENERPQKNVFSKLLDIQEPEAAKARAVLVATLKSKTVFEDSHPSVRERIEALGIPGDPEDQEAVDALIAMLGRVDNSAAEVFFGEHLQSVLDDVGSMWAASVGSLWKRSYEESQAAKSTIEKFEGRRLDSLSESETVEWISAKGAYFGEAETHDDALEAALRFPNNAVLQYFAGTCLRAADDDRAFAFYEAAANLDRKFEVDSLRAIAEFRASRGESFEARESAIIASEKAERRKKHIERLLGFGPGDELFPSEASPDEVERIVALLPRLNKVKRGYLYQRRDEVEGIRVEVLALVLSRPAYMSSEQEFEVKQLRSAYQLTGRPKGLYLMTFVERSKAARALESNCPNLIYERK